MLFKHVLVMFSISIFVIPGNILLADSWDQVGGALNISSLIDATNPSISFDNSFTPYIAWQEVTDKQNIYVKKLNSSSWEQVGGSLNLSPLVDAARPNLVFNGNVPYLAWQETTNKKNIYVKKYNGSSWELMIGSVNLNTNDDAFSAVISINPNTNAPWVSWDESTDKNTIYVKKFVTPTPTPVPDTHTFTPT